MTPHTHAHTHICIGLGTHAPVHEEELCGVDDHPRGADIMVVKVPAKSLKNLSGLLQGEWQRQGQLRPRTSKTLVVSCRVSGRGRGS